MSVFPIEKQEIPQSFWDYEQRKSSIQSLYSQTLEEDSVKKETSEKNLLSYSAELEKEKSELLRQERLLVELYKSLGRNLLLLVTILVSILIASYLIQWTIKTRSNFIEEKKHVLINVIKWISNISII